MRASDGFILGAITGAAIVWFWRRELEDYARDRTRGVRTRAAEGLQAVAEGTEKVLDRGGTLSGAPRRLAGHEGAGRRRAPPWAGRDSPHPSPEKHNLECPHGAPRTRGRTFPV